MRIVLLGTAAGGGVPQWNCACPQCSIARKTHRTRAQSCVGISADDGHWFLINAPPDLQQILAGFPPLHPKPGTIRNSPIEGVLLTNADLDHVLGLISLREGGSVSIHTPAGVRQALWEGLNMNRLLASYAKIEWLLSSEEQWTSLSYRNGAESSLSYRAIPLSNDPPRYAPAVSGLQSVAYEIRDEQTGGMVIIAPDVGAVSPEFLARLKEAQLIIFDGTFWSESELVALQISSRHAADMGHLPIESGSLPLLESLSDRKRVYLHINNTNPILSPDSPERQRVLQSGVIIGEDGMEFII